MTALVHHTRADARPSARPRLTRSPIYALTLAIGLLVGGAGWAAATLLDRTVLGLNNDLEGLRELLPPLAQSSAGYAAALGTIAAIVGIHAWLLTTRRHRELAVTYVGVLAAAGCSILLGDALEAVMDPALRTTTRVPSIAVRGAPTDPGVAAVFAILVLSRRWIVPRARLAIYAVIPFWLVAGSLVDPDVPYAGLLLDVGVGMTAGSAAGLLFRTPTIQPSAHRICTALAEVGLPIVDLTPAAVDARGSTPYFARTTDGRRLFVKALSTEQRAADLLYRATRWLRLRRSGDAPPEISLKRAAEHEAFVSHHVRSLGVPTPPLVALADLGDDNVAMAYEAVAGRSLDRVDPGEIADAQLVELWRTLGRMRAHGVAHRDLRLANLFLADDGRLLLIDFGFGEVAAPTQLLDTDAAELLASLATVVGPARAARTAVTALGPEVVGAAGDWLHPLALSGATRAAVAGSPTIDRLRAEIAGIVGHDVPEPEPLRRFAVERLIGAGMTGVVLLSLAVALVHDDTIDRLADADPARMVAATALGALVPLAAANALRSACTGRVSRRGALGAVLIGWLPVNAATSWSWSAVAASDRAARAGLRRPASRQAASLWVITGIFTASIAVGGIAAAGLRPAHGSLAATGLGAAVGGAVVVAQLALIRLTRWGRSLDAEWLRPFDPTAIASATARGAAVAGWWFVHAALVGAPLLLVARAFGLDAPAELVLAVGVAAPAIAWLSPARGGLGTTEALLYVGLASEASLADAALVVVVTRAVTHWVWVLAGLVVWRWVSARDERADEDGEP